MPAEHRLGHGEVWADFCSLHAEQFMFDLSLTVPSDEGREGYYRWCREKGIVPRVWAPGVSA